MAVLGASCATYGWSGPPSDHFDGSRFHNRAGGAELGVDELLEWSLHRETGPWRDWVDAEPGPRPPTRLGGGHLRVTFINHASVLIQMDGLNVLVDPVYSEVVGPLGTGARRHRPPGVRFEDLPPIDAVLVSHNHYDHMDFPTLRRLRGRDRPRIVAGLGNAELLADSGIDGGVDLDWGQTVRLSDEVVVHGAPVHHSSRRGVGDADVSLWLGFVLEGPSGRVYVAGDTAFGPHFAEARERWGAMRYSVLPIGQFRPRRYLGRMHMSPEEAIEAHRALGSAESLGVHWGTFQLADDGEREPVERLYAALAPEERDDFYVLRHGEGREARPLR